MNSQKSKSPLLTVYITNYNYGKYISKAVDSVLNQSFQDFEIIIIDDGSTDNSKEIIEGYSSNPKIKVIFQQNKGLNVTNNIALRVAQGDYIMRLDADDYLDPSALLVMSDLLEKDAELGLVFPDYFLVDAEDNILNIEQRHSFNKEVTLLDQPAHGACTMIRKKFLQQLGGYDEQYKCQDGYELWVKFTAKYKVSNVNTPLFYYRQHGENLTSNEERILDTRAKIKDNFVSKTYAKNLNVLAIIPVRGSKYNSKNIAFQKIGGKFVIDHKIEAALEANRITTVVVSSPDTDIEKHIQDNYSYSKKIRFHKRDEDLARLNTGLVGTVNNILEEDSIQNGSFELLSILSIEYPFITSTTMDDAINTIRIFEADSVISVRQETNMFFQHDGGGMKPILNQEKFSKLEREALYKYAGGIIVVSIDHFKETHQLISGVVGHIVVDQKSSHILKSKLDIQLAEFLAEN